jgi:hypothetical protein
MLLVGHYLVFVILLRPRSEVRFAHGGRGEQRDQGEPLARQ